MSEIQIDAKFVYFKIHRIILLKRVFYISQKYSFKFHIMMG